MWHGSERRGVLLICALTAACLDAGRATYIPSTVEGLEDGLVGQAAANFRSGRFVLAGSGPEEIDSSRALEFAVKAIEQFPTVISSHLRHTAARPLEATRLWPCNATYSARSHEDPQPTVFGPGDILLGPWWLVEFCEAGEPVAIAAVHAKSPPEYINSPHLTVQFYGISGEHRKLISAEQAAAMVVSATGARVSGVPVLLSPEYGHPAFYSRWRIVVDQPVRAASRRFGGTRDLRELYVGRDMDPDFRSEATDKTEVLVAIEDQPEAAILRGTQVTIVRRRIAAVRFEPLRKDAPL